MNNENVINVVTLESINRDEHEQFIINMKESFSVAIIETFGHLIEELIPPQKYTEQSLNDPDFDAYHIVLNGKGGQEFFVFEKVMK